jgi:dTDP-glucose 4,6-dehydratase
MNYLVTGGAGFIGSHFVDYILSVEPEAQIKVLDKLTYAGNLDNLQPALSSGRVVFIKGDICNYSMVVDLVQESDILVNFAAESHVDRSIEDSSEFIKTNIVGVETLLRASIRKKGIKFIQISTDEVYGSIDEGSAIEESLLQPSSPYAASKAAADLVCESYFKTFSIDVRITRCSNNFGTRQFPEKLIPLVLSRINTENKIPVYGTGKNKREWIHVADHCKGIYQVINYGNPGEIYNIGSGEEYSNIDLIRLILDKSGSSHDLIDFVKDRLGHDSRYSLDSTKIKSECGFSATENFETRIFELISKSRDS